MVQVQNTDHSVQAHLHEHNIHKLTSLVGTTHIHEEIC